MIDRLQVLMGRATYENLPPNMQQNLDTLIDAINNLLLDLNVENVTVSSGFRRPTDNAAAGGAKHSYHMQCMACDLIDIDSKLDNLFISNPDLLRKYNLWLESPSSTPGWAHLDIGTRTDRPSRVFLP